MGKLTVLDLELLLVREFTRAGADLATDVIEGDFAATQTELDYSIQKAAQPGPFRDKLSQAYQRAQDEFEDRRMKGEWARSRGETPGPAAEPRVPRGGLPRLATLLFLFSEDPDEFYWAVERARLAAGPALRLRELSDFLALHGARLAEARCPPSGRYCHLDGESWPPALVSAARTVLAEGGMARLREGIGLFRGYEQKELRRRVNAWVRDGD